MIEFSLDIPSLTNKGIRGDSMGFNRVRELHSSSMIDWLIILRCWLSWSIHSTKKCVSTGGEGELFGYLLKVVVCTCVGLGLFKVGFSWVDCLGCLDDFFCLCCHTIVESISCCSAFLGDDIAWLSCSIWEENESS